MTFKRFLRFSGANGQSCTAFPVFLPYYPHFQGAKVGQQGRNGKKMGVFYKKNTAKGQIKRAAPNKWCGP